MSGEQILWIAVRFGVPFLFIFLFAIAVMLPLLIYLERKVCAYIQDRRGPNRASVLGIRAFGLVHLVADVLKLIFKEAVEPRAADKPLYRIAPLIVMTASLTSLAAIPFGEPVHVGEQVIPLQIADLNAGLLYVFAISSLAVYGIILAGWSSGNKYSFLGALRGSSQMVSYEVTMGLAVLGILMVYGTASMSEVVLRQGPSPLHWGVVVSPLGFVLFLAAMFAETNRTPFDLPDAEAEVVAGYHLEFSGLNFGLFFMGEYAAMVVAASVISTLFFGGWQVPFLGREALEQHAVPVLQVLCLLGAAGLAAGTLALVNAARKPRRRFGDLRDKEPAVFAVLFALGAVALAALALFVRSVDFAPWMRVGVRVVAQASAFVAKVFFFSFFYIWVRWTLPRFRYDQLMTFGWKYMLPLGVANILITYAWGIEVLGP